jgi:hypothetical protein
MQIHPGLTYTLRTDIFASRPRQQTRNQPSIYHYPLPATQSRFVYSSVPTCTPTQQFLSGHLHSYSQESLPCFPPILRLIQQIYYELSSTTLDGNTPTVGHQVKATLFRLIGETFWRLLMQERQSLVKNTLLKIW